MPPTNSSLSEYIDQIAGGPVVADRLSWPDTSFTVNLSGLNDDAEMRQSAEFALQAWTATTGFTFTITTAAADITFDNEQAGAFCNFSFNGDNEITTASINVAKNFQNGFPVGSRWGIGDYGMQTFIHEIGHAFGLDHGGPYDGSGDYDTDAVFTLDTWQYSAMSYFEQSNNGDASDLFLVTPMLADIAAIRELYGPLTANAGATVYGTSGFYDFDADVEVARTISDSSGDDLIDCSDLTFGVRLNLTPGQFSNLNGYVENLAIAQGTVIERATGTSGLDVIFGNGVANTLRGLGANDRLIGGGGNDILEGGTGSDLLTGGVGADDFRYRTAAEAQGDLILDFDAGLDDILLSLIDANTALAGDQAFTFRGTGGFTGAGQVRYAFANGDTYIYGSTDADTTAEFTFRLDGFITVAASDFVL